MKRDVYISRIKHGKSRRVSQDSDIKSEFFDPADMEEESSRVDRVRNRKTRNKISQRKKPSTRSQGGPMPSFHLTNVLASKI